MDIEELRKQLIQLGIKSSSYSLSGGLPNEKYCLANESGKWVVYYSERGQRTGEKVFSSESKACEYLFSRMERDPTTRI